MDTKNYLPNIIKFIDKLKIKCEELSYCFDLTEKILPVGELYYDARHHNEKGNHKIANLIFEKIFNK